MILSFYAAQKIAMDLDELPEAAEREMIIEQEPHQALSMKEILDTLIHDTISSMSTKFGIIYNKDLINNPDVKIKFLDDSEFQKYKSLHYNPGKYSFIEGYDALLDSIVKNKVDLDINAFEFFNGDSMAYASFQFKNGLENTIHWDPREWGAYQFMGYYENPGYFWLQEVDHGTTDHYFDVNNGNELHFLPCYSPEKIYYCALDYGYEYADMQYLKLMVGKNLMQPIIEIYNDYYPFVNGYEYSAVFGFQEEFWIDNNSLVFDFFHKLEKDYNTIFYDHVAIKLTIRE